MTAIILASIAIAVAKECNIALDQHGLRIKATAVFAAMTNTERNTKSLSL